MTTFAELSTSGISRSGTPLNDILDQLSASAETSSTYVVDSDQSLAAWAANAPGYNYTSVLIKPGTWTSSVEVNLTTSKTKTVVGMPESKLVFTSTCGLRYDSTPAPEEECSMKSVVIEGGSVVHCANLVDCTSSIVGSTYGLASFDSCSYLTRCTGNANGDESNWEGIAGTPRGVSFSSCDHLTDCAAFTFANAEGITTGEDANSISFVNCYDLTRCIGYSTAYGAGHDSNQSWMKNWGRASAFVACGALNDCQGYAYGKASPDNLDSYGVGTAFAECSDLVRCTGQGISYESSHGGGRGFEYCNDLLDCDCSGSRRGKGFADCNRLTNCSSYIGTDGRGQWEVGFSNCNTITRCTSEIRGYTNVPSDTWAGERFWAFENCRDIQYSEGITSANKNVMYCIGGFNQCYNLSYCTASSTITGSGEALGFLQCDNLLSCQGSGSSRQHSSGFNDCDNLSNCSGAATNDDYYTNPSYYRVEGFSTCNSLLNCSSSSTGVAYNGCEDLTNCKTSSSPAANKAYYGCKNLVSCQGYAQNVCFDICRRMIFSLARSGTTRYNNCTVTSTSGTVANTAEGGWNEVA
jgi:hypothetical protein